MKKVIIAAIALFSMTACNVFEMPQTQMPTVDEGYGYLDLGISSETEMQVVTKATLSESELDSYNILIVNAEGTTVKSGKYADIKGDLKFPKGTYTVTATNMTSEEAHPSNGKGSILLSGSANVKVETGLTTSCLIECNPINSKVSFTYSDMFKTVFKSINSLNVVCEGRTVSMNTNFPTSKEDMDVAYFPAEEEVVWTLEATNTQDTKKTYTNKFNTQANKWSIVTFDIKGTDGKFTITVDVNGEITAEYPIEVELDPITGDSTVTLSEEAN